MKSDKSITKSLSIRNKIVLLFAVSTTCLMIGMVTVVGYSVKTESVIRYQENALKQLEDIKNSIDIFFDETLNMVDFLTSNETVRSADDSIHSHKDLTEAVRIDAISKSSKEMELVTLFKNVIAAYPDYVEVYLGTKWGGYASCFDGEMAGGYDPRKRGWYKTATAANGKAIITDAFSSTVGDVVVCLSKSVYSENNDFIGNIGVEVTLNTLTDLISKIKIGKNGYVILVQNDGTILADPVNPEFNFKNVNEIGNEGLAEVVNENLSKSSFKYNGNNWKADVLSIENTKWKLIALSSVKEIYQQYNSIIRLIFVLSLVLLLVFGFIFSSFAVKMLNPIASILSLLGKVSNGDFSERIKVTGKDDFSKLAEQFNHTFDIIQSAMKIIDTDAASIRSIGENLESNMLKTSSSVTQINANIEDVKQQTVMQAKNVVETSTAMKKIVDAIKKLNENIESQATSVSESSSSIEEMMANINSISHIVGQNKELMDKLHDRTLAGKNAAEESSNVAVKIAEESEHLLQTSDVIQNIASQTNLLAMNAAIEAAHVGAAGKGFAVVADEIRKLAQDSDNEGRKIAEVIQETLDIIQQLTIAGKQTAEAFEEVYSIVSETMEREDSIANAMQEQAAGSKEVLSAIHSINEITESVKSGSEDMMGGAELISSEMNSLNILTKEISSSMEEMAMGLNQINDAVQTVNDITRQNKESADSLVMEISKFKL